MESEDHIKNLADELARCKGMLEIKNTDFQKFVYIVSHDLQAPLKNLQLFVQLLESESSAKLDEESKELLKYIQVSALQISKQIQVLLNYSRLGNTQTKTNIDLNEVMETVQKNLSTEIARSDARLIYPQLPAIVGLSKEIYILFEALLSNALKFSKKNRSPVVELTIEEEEDRWVFAVKDNGIGIAETAYEQIFFVFQRLNPSTAYEGEGAGLAYAKRIVELHGGDIWVASVPHVGSTFFFTLAKGH